MHRPAAVLLAPAPAYACLPVHILFPASAPLPLQWDGVENKSSVIVYGAGSIVVLWLAATIVGALNSIPLVSWRKHWQAPA